MEEASKQKALCFQNCNTSLTLGCSNASIFSHTATLAIRSARQLEDDDAFRSFALPAREHIGIMLCNQYMRNSACSRLCWCALCGLVQELEANFHASRMVHHVLPLPSPPLPSLMMAPGAQLRTAKENILTRTLCVSWSSGAAALFFACLGSCGKSVCKDA